MLAVILAVIIYGYAKVSDLRGVNLFGMNPYHWHGLDGVTGVLQKWWKKTLPLLLCMDGRRVSLLQKIQFELLDIEYFFVERHIHKRRFKTLTLSETESETPSGKCRRSGFNLRFLQSRLNLHYQYVELHQPCSFCQQTNFHDWAYTLRDKHSMLGENV